MKTNETDPPLVDPAVLTSVSRLSIIQVLPKGEGYFRHRCTWFWEERTSGKNSPTRF